MTPRTHAPLARSVCLLLAAVAGLVLPACRNTDPITPAPDTVAAENYPNVVLDPQLRDTLVLNPPTVTPGGDGQVMAIRVPLRSVVDRTLVVQYRVTFFDASHQPLGTVDNWRSETFMPYARQILSANSISERATGWEIQIRPYRR